MQLWLLLLYLETCFVLFYFFLLIFLLILIVILLNSLFGSAEADQLNSWTSTIPLRLFFPIPWRGLLLKSLLIFSFDVFSFLLIFWENHGNCLAAADLSFICYWKMLYCSICYGLFVFNLIDDTAKLGWIELYLKCLVPSIQILLCHLHTYWAILLKARSL